MNKIKCSLCTQSFNADDVDLSKRLERHEKFHNLPIRNIVHGTVSWETIPIGGKE